MVLMRSPQRREAGPWPEGRHPSQGARLLPCAAAPPRTQSLGPRGHAALFQCPLFKRGEGRRGGRRSLGRRPVLLAVSVPAPSRAVT